MDKKTLIKRERRTDIIFALSVIILIVVAVYLTFPSYEIKGSYSISNSAMQTRETEVHVSVFTFWGYEKLLKDIEKEFNETNGTPTSLKINLYHFTTKNNTPFLTETFEY